jgi:Fic family protein
MMINKITRDKIDELINKYKKISKGKEDILREISLAEIPEMVYNSNAIENSTLSLEDTEKILSNGELKRKVNIREIYEAKNLAQITETLLEKNNQKLSVKWILELHKILLTNIDNTIAGRFRTGKEWVRVGNHLGANPLFVNTLMNDLVNHYNKEINQDFLDKIARFHAEFETIHPFCDGNGRIGRVLINLQLANLNLPPIIIQNKSKRKDYYPLFVNYPVTMKYDGFTALFAILLQESLHKRIALLTAKRIIPLSIWAEKNSIKPTIAANKAKRQTIPAFRMSEKWMIDEDF